jgi:hypothetical protein
MVFRTGSSWLIEQPLLLLYWSPVEHAVTSCSRPFQIDCYLVYGWLSQAETAAIAVAVMMCATLAGIADAMAWHACRAHTTHVPVQDDHRYFVEQLLSAYPSLPSLPSQRKPLPSSSFLCIWQTFKL